MDFKRFRPEAFGFGGHRVSADRKLTELILAGGVGNGRTGKAGFVVDGGYGGTLHHRAGGIGYAPVDRRSDRLSGAHGTEDEKRKKGTTDRNASIHTVLRD